MAQSPFRAPLEPTHGHLRTTRFGKVENKKVWIAADYFVGVAAWDLGWLGIGLFGQLPPGLDR